jgi:ribose-phosphate pyrophosphokinase
MKNLRLFGLKGSEKYAKRVANFLDIKLAKHEERLFSDGEPFVKPDENVRGCDVYVIS